MKKILIIASIAICSCVKKEAPKPSTVSNTNPVNTIAPPSNKYLLKDINTEGADTVFFEDNLYLYDASVSLADTNGTLSPIDVFYRVGFKKTQYFEESTMSLYICGVKRSDSTIVPLYIQSPNIFKSKNNTYYADSSLKFRWAARLLNIKKRNSEIYYKYLVKVGYKKKGSTVFTYSPYITLKKGYMPDPVIK